MANVTVRIRSDESFEKALRRFTRQVEGSGTLKEMKKRQHYEKPSEKRNRTKRDNIRRAIKKSRKQYK